MRCKFSTSMRRASPLSIAMYLAIGALTAHDLVRTRITPSTTFYIVTGALPIFCLSLMFISPFHRCPFGFRCVFYLSLTRIYHFNPDLLDYRCSA